MAEKLEEKTKCPLIGCLAKERRTEMFQDNICETDNYVHCRAYEGRNHNLDTTEDTY